MRFVVAPEVFARFPDVCIGVVVARGVHNDVANPRAEALLAETAQELRLRLGPVSPREHPAVAVWREAFRALGINPNRFPSSIEAMVSRVAKGGGLPFINPAVAVANAVSLRYLLPIGAHDLGRMKGDLRVRPARTGDTFTPMGGAVPGGSETLPEAVEPGEFVYADDEQVRTRRWTWRQGEYAKVTPDSRWVLFPIDGFRGYNDDAVRAAREDLAGLLSSVLQARTSLHWIDIEHPAAELGEREDE